MKEKTTTLSIGFALLLVAAVLVAAIASENDGTSSDRPGAGSCRNCNVFLIVMDSLRRDHLGCYGYPKNTSPNIDALAESAIRFENMIAVAPWTKPSITSMLTGLYPKNHRIKMMRQGLPEDSLTLQEILAGRGYATAAFFGNPVLLKDKNLVGSFAERVLYKETNENRNQFLLPKKKAKSNLIVRDLVRFLSTSRKSKTFFYIHFMDTHHSLYERLPSSASLMERRPDDSPVERYDKAIRTNDAQLGLLFEEIKKQGMWDNSIIMLVADHGESFGEHENFRHFNNLFDVELRVPFIVRTPSGGRGVHQGLGTHIDVTPTILSLLGIPSPPGIDGIDLNSEKRNLVFSEVINNKDDQLYSVRTLTDKLIFNQGESRYSCYNLQADPSETNDVFSTSSQICIDLKRAVDSFVAQVPRAGEASTIEFNEEDIQQLKALGYVE